MYYIGNVVKSVAGFYNQINSATLTGAIDIVVVQQEDGTFVGSPFHVRFGKLGVLSSREKVVEIAINDVEVDLQMKLGAAGEAFFVEEVLSEENVPYNLATSPIPSSSYLLDNKFNFKERNKDFVVDVEEEDETELEPSPTTDQPKIHGEKTSLNRIHSSPIPISSKMEHLNIPSNKSVNKLLHDVQLEYPLSDMDSPISGSPNDDELLRKVYSDTEIETSTSKMSASSHQSIKNQQQDQDMTWEWGMLPEGTEMEKKKSTRETKSSLSDAPKKSNKKPKLSKLASPAKAAPPSEGLLLEEVLEMEDKEVADLYLNRANSWEDIDSGYGQVSTPSTSKESPPKFVYNTSPVKPQESPEEMSKDDTLPNMDEEEPRDVVMSLCGGLMNRRVSPEKFNQFVVSYEDFCKNPGLLNDPKLVIKINESYYNWAVAGPYLMSYMVYERTLQPECLKTLKQRFMPKKRRGWFSWRTPQDQESSEEEANAENQQDVVPQVLENLVEGDNEDNVDSDSGGIQGGGGGGSDNMISDDDSQEYKKTLRLTSDEWKKLNLKFGKNKVTFTVTTRYQGMASCHARIFLWSHADKVVISDIDGTITKSDVLGQILPAMGRDWSQTGVTGLFSKIKQNGYNFIYLSARAISQAQLTRDFLHSVKQGELTLPEGPVMLTPTSLLHAFKKEVIERKPEEFKISCMKDIQRLYEKSSNPFYAGFGNRINDVYAYRAVGIPISRIFTINYKGEISHEKSKAFSSSYSELIELVDQMFPPLSSSKSIDPAQSEYTAFSFWRTPVSDLPDITDNPDDFEFP